MTSEVDIVNMGLDMVGAETITSLTEGSNNANVANRNYSEFRDYLLRRYLWKFATKRIKLAQSSNTPVYEFDYQYPIPSDFIRIWKLHDNEDGLGVVPYKLEFDATDTRVLSCSADNVWLTYIFQNTDPNDFDPDFRVALACRLAMIFALKIAESRSLYKEMKADFKEAVRGARSVSGQEDFPEEFPEGSWTQIRNDVYGGGWT